MATLRERIEGDEGEMFFDSVIRSHGFTNDGRDYEFIIDVPAALPPDVPIGDSVGSYFIGRWRYRFTHSTTTEFITAVSDEVWRQSWSDLFIDYEEWQRAGSPEGFVWGVGAADGYPGLSYVADSQEAAAWTERLGHQMHEVLAETNVFRLRLLCHDLVVEQIATGDPVTRKLTPLDG